MSCVGHSALWESDHWIKFVNIIYRAWKVSRGLCKNKYWVMTPMSWVKASVGL